MRSLLIAFILGMFGCGGDNGRTHEDQRQRPTQEQMIEENRNAIKWEHHDIDLYLRRKNFEAASTGTGVRYRFLRDEAGNSVRPGQWAVVNYRVELLNGDTAYQTSGGAESFKVEMDDVESGLHEAIQLMSPGDSATLIIPSYRAHGLIGDMNKIPMRSTVVYHIGLVKASGDALGK